MLRGVSEIAYKLALPPSLLAVHLVFHVSMLKKYMPDGLNRLQYEELYVFPDLSYEEEATLILDRLVKTLCKEMLLVKVLYLW